MAECDIQEAVLVARGFQFQNHWSFSHHIKCVTQRTSDAVIVFYNIGSENVASLCPYKPHNPRTKHSLPSNVSDLIYVRKFRLFVASCPDLSLRVYGEDFELIDSVQTGTVLSLAFNEATSELYTGGVGCIKTWVLRHQLHNPLVPSKPFTCSVGADQWVVSLDFDPCSKILVVTCQDVVYVINTISRSQTNAFSNTHQTSLTSAVYFHLLEYVITGSKDGSIKVWNCTLDSEVHTFTGHLKAVTALKVHPNAPCVISCSLDGSIRTWHLENMSQCYYLDCGEQLQGMCTDFPYGNRLACYSYNSVLMWQVNQVETHFATVNSHVLTMSRVEDYSKHSKDCTTARVLALAEDGGVRLLSPITGQVISILLPMSSSQLLSDVVYSMMDGLLFVLLKSSEVVVFNASTNPCSACQLWVASQNRKLLSIALCNVLLANGETCSVVFGGDMSGHVALLFSSRNKLSMQHPCPAHDGHVTMLTSSCDLIVPFSNDSSGSNVVQTALISYGSDNMLNIWCLKIRKSSQISLKLQMSVHTKLEPVHCRLLGSIISLSFLDNRLVMLNTPKRSRPDSRIIATSHSLDKMSLLRHQLEDDHTDTLLSLQCCPSLGLFATSSKDGLVKIWNSQNQLVSEIDFEGSLASVCFANSQGDLLVGFQKHISLISASDYLPDCILEMNKSFSVTDCIEQPMTFDSNLPFWYDSKRVPSLSADQDSRPQHEMDCKNTGKVSTNQAQKVTMSEPLEAEMSASAKSLDSKVDVSLARELSQQYATTILNAQSRFHNKKIQHHNMHQKDIDHALPCVVADKADDSAAIQAGGSSCLVPAVSSLTSVTVNSGLNFFHQMASTEHVASESRRESENLSGLQLGQQMSPLTNFYFPTVEVSRIRRPSRKFPIAPDCFIPNSVLRSKFKYSPPIVILKPYQPPNIREKMMKMDRSRVQMLSGSESNTSCFSAYSDYQYNMEYSDSNSSQNSNSRETITCVSRLSSSKKSRRQASTRQRSSRNRNGLLHPISAEYPNLNWNDSKNSLNLSTSNLSLDKPESRSSDNQFLKLPSKSNISAKGSKKVKKTVKLDVNSIKGGTQAFMEVSKTTKRRDSRGQRRVSIADSSSGHSPQEGSSKRARRRSHDHSSHDDRITAGVHRRSLQYSNPSQSDLSPRLSLDGVSSRPFPRRDSSLIFSGKSAVAGATQGSTIELDALRTVMLQKIVNSSWYPHDVRSKHTNTGSAADLEEVISTLLHVQKTSSSAVFKEICSIFMELNRGGVLTSNQKMAVACELSKRMSSSIHSPLTTAALSVLEKIAVGTKQVILQILPLLTDQNVEVRYAAFSALRAITGVANRSQLHELLIKLGLLQDVEMDEDETINSLAERVGKGDFKLTPNSRILDICSIGVNFTPGQTHNTSKSRSFKDECSEQFLEPPDYSSYNLSAKARQRGRYSLQNGDISALQHGRSDLQHIQRSFPGENDYQTSRGTRKRGEGVRKQSSRENPFSMLGEGILQTPNTLMSHFKSKKSNTQGLFLQHPNNFSQTKEAVQTMLRAYGCEDIEGAAEYEWSEIFEVVRKPSRSHYFSNNRKSVTLCLDPLHETHLLRGQVLPGETKLRLPHIDAPLKAQDWAITDRGNRGWSKCESDIAKESLRKTTRAPSHSRCIEAIELDVGASLERIAAYHESKNAGLVIKLPQIANLRVAAQKS